MNLSSAPCCCLSDINPVVFQWDLIRFSSFGWVCEHMCVWWSQQGLWFSVSSVDYSLADESAWLNGECHLHSAQCLCEKLPPEILGSHQLLVWRRFSFISVAVMWTWFIADNRGSSHPLLLTEIYFLALWGVKECQYVRWFYIFEAFTFKMLFPWTCTCKSLNPSCELAWFLMNDHWFVVYFEQNTTTLWTSLSSSWLSLLCQLAISMN